MTREEAMDILSTEIKLATLKGNTRLENALRWAVNDMATSNNWDKICQDLWIENEELEEKLKNSIPVDVDCDKCVNKESLACNRCFYQPFIANWYKEAEE